MRKNIIKLFAIAGIAVAISCSQEKRESAIENSGAGTTSDSTTQINTDYGTPTKLKEFVTGNWTLTSGQQGEGDQTQRIEFTVDGRYTRYTGNEKVESGAYRVNEQHRILYLDASLGGQPSEWEVTLNEEDQMTMELAEGSRHGEGYTFVYQRN